MPVGQYLKTLEGQLERVQCMELVGTQVWSGSSFGMINIHDAKVDVETKTENHRYRSE